MLGRVFAERPLDDDRHAANDMVAALRYGPEATGAFIDYLRLRKGLRRLAPGGELAVTFATTRRDGEEQLTAELHEIRDGQPRHDLWTFLSDTGVVLELATKKNVGVDWTQGSFEATRPSLSTLASKLEAAAWRRGLA